MIVMKFGGSSVESAVALQRIGSIVKARLAQRPVVVVSAMGKTTNRLLAIAEAAVRGQRQEAMRLLGELRAYHLREGEAAVAPDDVSELRRIVHQHFRELTELVLGLAVLGELTPRSIDSVGSYGERLSSLIVAMAFRHQGIAAVHVDSRELIVTDKRHTHATPLYAETYKRLAAALPSQLTEHVVVMGGFIGANEDGITTTLGRGGSDFSASLIGAGIGAREIQIWTDVDGMLTCDPTVHPGGRRIKVISFSEAAELAYFGAKVLHPATVMPAIERNIPVLILNSRRPEVAGTRISAESEPSQNIAKSIACKKNVTLLNINSRRMFMAHGFMRRIFEVFDRHEISVDMVATSEVSVSLTIDPTSKLPALMAELSEFSDVSVEENRAIICMVGRNIGRTPGVVSRVFDALGPVDVRMVSQGASSLNLGFVVAAEDLSTAVASLHDEFFAVLDPAVFDA